MEDTRYQRIPNPGTRDAVISADAGSSCTGTASISSPPIPKKWVQVAGLRYYSPELGRWISTDPIGLKGASNTWEYGRNRPISTTDAVGLKDICCLAEPLRITLLKTLDKKGAAIHFEMTAKFDNHTVLPNSDCCRAKCCEFHQEVRGKFVQDGKHQDHTVCKGKKLDPTAYQDDCYSRENDPDSYTPVPPFLDENFRDTDTPRWDEDGIPPEGAEIEIHLEFRSCIRTHSTNCPDAPSGAVSEWKDYSLTAEGKSPDIEGKAGGALKPKEHVAP